MNATPTKSSSTEKPTIEAPPPLGLVTLAERCGELHRAGTKNRQELRALLTKAKQDAGPGGWTRWLADNREVLGFGERQAQVYLLSEAHHGAALAAKAADAQMVRDTAKIVAARKKEDESPAGRARAAKEEADRAAGHAKRDAEMAAAEEAEEIRVAEYRKSPEYLERMAEAEKTEFTAQVNKDQKEALAEIAKRKAEREADRPNRERRLTLVQDLVTEGYKAMLEKFKCDELNELVSPSELEEIRDRLLQMVEQEWEV